MSLTKSLDLDPQLLADIWRVEVGNLGSNFCLRKYHSTLKPTLTGQKNFNKCEYANILGTIEANQISTTFSFQQ
ncbi:hypothetical protein [Nostoc sp. DSM 114160]